MAAPLSDGIEILERESDRVHHFVAARADRIGAVLFHAFAQRQRFAIAIFFERRNIGRRRSGRNSEQIRENPFAALHRRRAIRIRGHSKNAALAEQTATVFGRQRDAAELASVDVRNAVVPRQTFIDEGVVGVQQVHHAAVFAHDALEEELRFLAHRLAQVVVEIGEDLRIGRGVLEVAQEQPLLGEVVDQRVGALVGKHALHLLFQYRVVVQFALARQIQQFVVRRTAPQEERKSRSQRDIAELIRRIHRNSAGIGLKAEQELRARQNELKRRFDARLEVAVRVAPALIKAERRFEVAILEAAGDKPGGAALK